LAGQSDSLNGNSKGVSRVVDVVKWLNGTAKKGWPHQLALEPDDSASIRKKCEDTLMQL
jgi:hypothetical protein